MLHKEYSMYRIMLILSFILFTTTTVAQSEEYKKIIKFAQEATTSQGISKMPAHYYGPVQIAKDIKSGNVDLRMVGDSQLKFGDNRGMEGICVNWLFDNWCGRQCSGSIASNANGTNTQATSANGGDTTDGNINIEVATNDSDAETYWNPGAYREVEFVSNHGNTARIAAFRNVNDGRAYNNSNPFVGKKMKGWVLHRASNATQRLTGYRTRWYDGPTARGAGWTTTTMGTGLGIEAGTAIYLDAADHTQSGDLDLELRVVPVSGEDESGGRWQHGGAVYHVVNTDNSRGKGVVLFGAQEDGWAASNWNTNYSQANWQKWIAATDTGPDVSIVAIMIGHNGETGNFEDNITTLMTRIRDAHFAATGTYPKFLLIAPWNYTTGHNMSAAKNTTLKGLVGVGTAYGDVACISLWDYFDGATPSGFTNLHPQDNDDCDLVWGAAWTILDGAASLQSLSQGIKLDGFHTTQTQEFSL